MVAGDAPFGRRCDSAAVMNFGKAAGLGARSDGCQEGCNGTADAPAVPVDGLSTGVTSAPVGRHACRLDDHRHCASRLYALSSTLLPPEDVAADRPGDHDDCQVIARLRWLVVAHSFACWRASSSLLFRVMTFRGSGNA